LFRGQAGVDWLQATRQCTPMARTQISRDIAAIRSA
jgi:hypothetical protein